MVAGSFTCKLLVHSHVNLFGEGCQGGCKLVHIKLGQCWGGDVMKGGHKGGRVTVCGTGRGGLAEPPFVMHSFVGQHSNHVGLELGQGALRVHHVHLLSAVGAQRSQDGQQLRGGAARGPSRVAEYVPSDVIHLQRRSRERAVGGWVGGWVGGGSGADQPGGAPAAAAADAHRRRRRRRPPLAPCRPPPPSRCLWCCAAPPGPWCICPGGPPTPTAPPPALPAAAPGRHLR